MAKASSIGRLHEQGKLPNLGNSIKPDREPVNSTNFVDSQPDLLAMQTAAWQYPARRRFGPQGRLAAPPMMSAMHAPVVPEGRNSFAAMAMRETVQQMRETAMRRFSQQAQRGGAGHQPWPMAIQI
jgi:hypothetical protein